jgi:glycosyltransferase involved in cell wall biosynthesis
VEGPIPITGGPLLSLCIPTHHGRAAQLDRLLSGIAAQLPGDGSVEVCVSDNGSRDETQEVLERYRETLGERLVAGRNDTNLGLTPNLLRVIELAHGRFCWFLGSDDSLPAGALAEVLAMLAAHPDLTGASVAPRRVAWRDMSTPAPAIPHEALPAERVPTLFTGLPEILGALGVLPCWLCVHIVRRERWLAAVAADLEGVYAAGDFPQVLVIDRMFQADPLWFWHPAQLVLSGAGTFYLDDAGEMGGEPVRQVASMTRDLDHIWSTQYGRLSRQARALMYRWYRICTDATAVQSSRLTGLSSVREDIRQLWGAIRSFWWMRHFRRHALPWLLLPSAVGSRWPARALEPSDSRARVAVELPPAFVSGYQHAVACVVENVGAKTFPSLGKRPVRIASRWFDVHGCPVPGDPPRSALFPPLRPGRSRSVEVRVDAPHVPGDYVLRITAVQEGVRWFDDADPASGWAGTVAVVDAPLLGD